eukprot:gnl/TRDRNA2_/TRDRNA2_176458_c0_seq3.p1 gnl/TRDRNA2_/TRDRNA2_176458_c0~~gnl/TRDRNA2_/TRDRNA2_176458_c0_seq3.p1  ORF type:complete len:901 (-),score=157.19 gnl/TRDRNA2_/TRDRNA2_176458_c0_seq3:112-2814(-)
MSSKSLNSAGVGPSLTYAKFTMAGWTGPKHVVFVPDSMTFDKAALEKVVDALKWTFPNLLIGSASSTMVPSELWTDKELSSKCLKKLRECGLQDEQVNDMMKECLVQKIKAIINAVLSAAEQTGSWSIHDGIPTTADILTQSCVRQGSLGTKLVNFFDARPSSTMAMCRPESWSMIKQLYDASKPISQEVVEGFVDPVVLESELLAAVKSFTDKTQWPGHFYKNGSTPLPIEKRAVISQWLMADADLFFLKIPGAGLPESIGPISPDPANCESNDWAIDFNLLGAYGLFVVGGRGSSAKDQILNSFVAGSPCVIVNLSGGVANSSAQLILAIKGLINRDEKLIRKLSGDDKKKEKARPGSYEDLSLNQIFSMVNAGLLLQHVDKKAGRMPGEKGMFTVAEVATVIDMAKARYKYFIETVKVVDPLKDSPEDCLERLSACFSSTYTGVLELGASAAQVDVVVEAWRMHRLFTAKAASLRSNATVLTYLCALASFIAIVISIFIEEMKECLDSDLHTMAICRLAGYLCAGSHATLAKYNKYMKWAIVFIPIVSALFSTVGSYFMFLENWAIIKLKCAQLVRDIYLFRAGIGPYSTEQPAPTEGGEEENVSPSAMKTMIRKKFVTQITEIFHSVMSTGLKDDTVTENQQPLTKEDLPDYVMASLYGDSRPRLSIFAMCCGCSGPSRNRGQRVAPGGALGPESTPLTAPGDLESNVTEEEFEGVDAEDDWVGDMDDFVSSITAEVYYDTRVAPLTAQYSKNTPLLSSQQQVGNMIIFLCGFIASMLGAFDHSSLIPIVVGFSSMLTVLMGYHHIRQELGASNVALTTLRRKQVEWAASSNVDRRTPMFKYDLVMTVEEQALAVTQAIVGSVAAGGSSSKEHKKGDKDEDKKEKKKDGKKKQVKQ